MNEICNQAKEEEHKEEEEGPEWRTRQQADGLGVCDEGQALSGLNDVFDAVDSELKFKLA